MSHNKKYTFMYIVCHDGQVTELLYTPERYQALENAKKHKGVFSLEGRNIFFDGASIAKVLDEAGYKFYIKTVQPKIYIKHGVWYDSKENRVIDYEPWKQKEIDETLKIENKKPDLPQVNKEKLSKIKNDIKNILAMK